MEYSSMAAVALIVHYIVNHNAFANRHYGSDAPAGKALRRLILCIAVFFVSDARMYDRKGLLKSMEE